LSTTGQNVTSYMLGNETHSIGALYHLHSGVGCDSNVIQTYILYLPPQRLHHPSRPSDQTWQYCLIDLITNNAIYSTAPPSPPSPPAPLSPPTQSCTVEPLVNPSSTSHANNTGCEDGKVCIQPADEFGTQYFPGICSDLSPQYKYTMFDVVAADGHPCDNNIMDIMAERRCRSRGGKNVTTWFVGNETHKIARYYEVYSGAGCGRSTITHRYILDAGTPELLHHPAHIVSRSYCMFDLFTNNTIYSTAPPSPPAPPTGFYCDPPYNTYSFSLYFNEKSITVAPRYARGRLAPPIGTRVQILNITWIVAGATEYDLKLDTENGQTHQLTYDDSKPWRPLKDDQALEWQCEPPLPLPPPASPPAPPPPPVPAGPTDGFLL
jgi:hypothetical protein